MLAPHLASEGPHRELIARLRCMCGIDTLTAVGLVAEAGDFSRFKSAAARVPARFVVVPPNRHLWSDDVH